MRNLLWCANHTPTSEQLESLNEMGNLLFLKDIVPELMTRLSNTPSVRSECKILADEISEVAERFHAKIIQLGIGNLWKLAVDHPKMKVEPCIHRAPEEKSGQKRLLLIC